MKKLLIVLLTLTFVSSAQISEENQLKVDALQEIVKTAKHDSIIINAWTDWDDIIYSSDPDLDLKLNQKIDSLCGINLKKKSLEQEEKLFYQKLVGKCSLQLN